MAMDPATVRKIYDDLSKHTVWSAMERTAKRLPTKTAVIDGDRRFTYAEVLSGANALVPGLRGLGLKKGSMVAVYVPNCAELVFLFYALQRIGVVVAWLNPNYRETEARFILENSGAEAVFLFDQWQGYAYLEGIAGLDGLSDLRHIVAVRHQEPVAVRDPRVRTLADLRNAPPATDPAGEDVGPDDLSMLIYTSGTTGRSKGAMIRQSQVVRGGWSYSIGVDATEDDVFIGFLPMSHSYGCGALLVQPFVLGATIALLDQFSAERAFALIEKERVTLQPAAPAHYILELKHPKRKDYDISSLRAGLSAGQIIPPNLITQVGREMDMYLTSFLGSSEVGPGLSIILPYGASLEVRETSIGYPLEYTQARIVDPATGEEKGPGEAGELLLSGWHVTQGYWNNPKETANQIRGGWLYTGDLASRDENGAYRILGRLKEWINRGGFKIVPSEIESLLVHMPGVMEACVVGTANPVLGESICACVRMEEEAKPLTLGEVRRFLESKVAPYKLPDELLLVHDFPRLSGGLKINRFGKGGVMDLAQTSTDKQSVSH